MSRLTRNQEKCWGKGNYKGEKYIIGSDGVTSKQMCLNKLGKLEDLEEQLGCPFEVIEKAIKNGIYTNVYSGICYVTRSDDYLLVSDDYDVRLSDYKKTWWLKEDKSE